MNSAFLIAWKRLINLLNMERKDVLQVLYYAIFAGVVSLSLPLGIQAIINLIQGAQISTSWIVLVVLVSLGVVFVGVLQLFQFRIIENIQQKLFTRAAFDFTYQFPKIKMSELHSYYPPELANRFFDILIVQKGVSKLMVDLPAALLQILLGLVLLSFYHPFFIIYGLLLLLLIYILFKYSAQKGIETSLEESKNKYRVAHWIQEVARSLVSFKLSGATQLAMDKNDRLVNDYIDAREGHFKILVFQFSKMIVFKLLVTSGLLIVGGLLVLNQQMNIGQFVAAEIIILLIISSVEKLILGLESFYDVLTSLEKLGQVIDKELEPQEGERLVKKEEGILVEWDEVVYQVNGTLLLEDISLEIAPKDRLLVLGSSGSGKGMLLRLLAGVEAPTQGTIYVNRRNLSSIFLNSYRAQIGLSLLEETPFEGSLRENLTFGNTEATVEEIMQVIDLMGLNNFVKKLKNGLDTKLYPEGKMLSHVVSRKIILARALLKKPKMLLLQEPFEFFDKEEITKLIDYLTDPKHPWSLVVVSSNSYWKDKMNRTLVMEKGRIKTIN